MDWRRRRRWWYAVLVRSEPPPPPLRQRLQDCYSVPHRLLLLQQMGVERGNSLSSVLWIVPAAVLSSLSLSPFCLLFLLFPLEKGGRRRTKLVPKEGWGETLVTAGIRGIFREKTTTTGSLPISSALKTFFGHTFFGPSINGAFLLGRALILTPTFLPALPPLPGCCCCCCCCCCRRSWMERRGNFSSFFFSRVWLCRHRAVLARSFPLLPSPPGCCNDGCGREEEGEKKQRPWDHLAHFSLSFPHPLTFHLISPFSYCSGVEFSPPFRFCGFPSFLFFPRSLQTKKKLFRRHIHKWRLQLKEMSGAPELCRNRIGATP